MLAYPTPTFDARTILQAPGFRPTGKSSGLVYEAQPEAVTAPSVVNRTTANGGFVGSRSKNFIQSNQWNTSELKFDPMKGSPLSKPGSVGNVIDQAIGCQPKYAEPENGDLKAILNILNGKPQVGEVERLSAKQVASLEKKGKGPVIAEAARRLVDDFTDARESLRKQNLIQKAIRQGFSKNEAEEAYKKVRVREAEATLFKEEDPSVRLYDLIDSRVGGTQDGSLRSNDETGLWLAKGGNAVLVKQSETRNAIMDKKAGFDRPMKAFGPLKEFLETGKPIVISKPKPALALEDRVDEVIQTVGFQAMERGELPEGLRMHGQRGRPKGAKDVNPRKRPVGLKYKTKG